MNQLSTPEYLTCAVTTPTSCWEQNVDSLAAALVQFSIGMSSGSVREMSHRKARHLRGSIQQRYSEQMLTIREIAEKQDLLHAGHQEKQDLLHANHLEKQDLLHAGHQEKQDIRHESHLESMQKHLKLHDEAISKANMCDIFVALYAESSPESVSE